MVYHKQNTIDPETNKIVRTYIYPKVEKCSTKYIDAETIKKNKLENYYCYEKADHKFGGPDPQNQFNYIAMIVRFCSNETEERYNITCAPKEEIRKRYEGKKSWLNILYQHNIFHASNYKYPYSKAYFMKQTGLDIYDHTKALYDNLYYRKADIVTDSGVIFQEYEESRFLEFDYMDFELEPPEDGNKYFAKIYMKTWRSDKTYYRTYIKIPDIIANVGGFISLVDVFFRNCYLYYLENEFFVFLYSNLFFLQIEEKLNEEQESRQVIIHIENKTKSYNNEVERKNINFYSVNDKDNPVSQNASISINDQNTPKRIFLRDVNINKFKKSDVIVNKEIHKLLNFKSRKRRDVEISNLERNLYICCCQFKPKSKEQKLKYELMLAAEAAIEQKADILEVWKTLDQFRLLIKLVLNESQSFMIQNRGKQLITNELNGDICLEEIKNLEKDKAERNKQKLIEYLKERKENKTLTDVDILLTKYLKLEIKEEVKNKVSLD